MSMIEFDCEDDKLYYEEWKGQQEWQDREKPIPISPRHLYNLLAYRPSDKNPAPLCIDFRAATDFELCHSRLSISAPIESTNLEQLTVSTFVPQVELVIKNADDLSKFRWRSIYKLVIVDEDPLLSEKLATFFAKEQKARCVMYLKVPFSQFSQMYPFRCAGKSLVNVPDFTLPFPSLVKSGLYIGSKMTAYSRDQLVALNIRYIVNCASELRDKFDTLNYLRLDWDDDPIQQLKGMEEAIEFIDKALSEDENVMVHCVEGKSRSAALITYYLMRKHGGCFQQASQFLAFARPTVDMNKGFASQLNKAKLPPKMEQISVS